MRAVIGDTQSGYLHNMVYDWPGLGSRLGMMLRASMEGFEHANKVAGATLCNECSFGGRTRRRDGKRRHEYMQYLEHRRAGTVSAQEMGRVNMFSKAQELTLPAQFGSMRERSHVSMP